MLFKPFERTFAHPLLSGSVGTLAIGILLIPMLARLLLDSGSPKWLLKVGSWTVLDQGLSEAHLSE